MEVTSVACKKQAAAFWGLGKLPGTVPDSCTSCTITSHRRSTVSSTRTLLDSPIDDGTSHRHAS